MTSLSQKTRVACTFTALSLAIPGSALALTQGQCADAVVRACNKAHPNNCEGRIACVNNGLDSCDTLAQNSNGGDQSGRGVRGFRLKR